MRHVVLVIALVLSTPGLFAQGEIQDSSLQITAIRISYAGQVPGGHMVQRFGWNSQLGFHADFKNRKNFLFGLEGSFIFGKKVKEDVMSNLRTPDSAIIDQNGSYAIVLAYERGFMVNSYVGYLWNKIGPNPNSGLLIKAGVGYLQHKIRIEHNKNNVPALTGEYLYGYDRLTSGINFTEFIGYQLLSNSKLLNFFAGFEFTQAFTQSKRDWNFNEYRKDDTKRKDYLYGIRVGWIIPLYKRAPRAVYY
ncbi:MAG TPA: hypothetical protein VK177_17210 [Flavobacteriales bacterium]|nr:hypothetical protein [Flavobacteriales bacterium]